MLQPPPPARRRASKARKRRLPESAASSRAHLHGPNTRVTHIRHRDKIQLRVNEPQTCHTLPEIYYSVRAWIIFDNDSHVLETFPGHMVGINYFGQHDSGSADLTPRDVTYPPCSCGPLPEQGETSQRLSAAPVTPQHTLPPPGPVLLVGQIGSFLGPLGYLGSHMIIIWGLPSKSLHRVPVKGIPGYAPPTRWNRKD